MARGVEGNGMATPRPTNPGSQQSAAASSQKNQKSILGFFQKKAPATPDSHLDSSSTMQSSTSALVPKPKGVSVRKTAALTPVPSSDVDMSSSPAKPDPLSPRVPVRSKKLSSHDDEREQNGVLPSPAATDDSTSVADRAVRQDVGSGAASPSRKAKKVVNYAESSDEGDDDMDEVFRRVSGNRRSAKRRKVVREDSDDGDDFALDEEEVASSGAEDTDDFIVPDDSDEELARPRKRKRSTKSTSQEEAFPARSSPPSLQKIPTDEQEIPTVSTARQWEYDPENPQALNPDRPKHVKSSDSTRKQKACAKLPAQRYPWLASIQDKERHPPDHSDYDPRTLYVPPMAWAGFSPFEKQYWEIKQNFWDTIVFFKKGKFYELYENDATIGSQLFDLKLTDRVNMSMVGVPEASLDYWACQFVAKGFKIAKVDQMESALGKEMRERDDKGPVRSQKEEKIIRRELASVLTSGTLVDAGMLQGDMSTYCVAIKEIDQEGLPAFGIAFVDTATAQFHLTDIQDDADMTKFETLIAQIRPGELLLEKSCLSTRALRILKHNATPTTIWNWLKPTKEFWPADITCREIDATGYFVNQEAEGTAAWPRVLEEARGKDLVMSAFGALTQYLRVLKIDRDLVSLGNISWYDPIKRASTLVLDGQSLINLEIFANSYDGGSEGTLFALLNRCVTPFGKRMLQTWVCHPLADARKINARLDAVEALMADHAFTDRFTASLTKMPDLERLISRVHAKRCKAQEFVKILEGFEQIEYTMGLLNSYGKGDGIIGQLISSMPDLKAKLDSWKHAFNRETARESGILVPEPGVEEDYDEAAEAISTCEKSLDKVLQKARKEIGSSAICYRDNGKEIYQLEIPVAKIKSVPSSWDQMSATAKVKRYYSPELRKLVRGLQEARETYASIVKDVAGRFYARFDEDYSDWLAAVRIIANLDCLISLSRASQALGQPSCRPEFVDDEAVTVHGTGRSVLDFQDLRHPTMLSTVSDFIPNDISLGGAQPNLALLTGANAAGKSTVLRMTCVAVILAQLGCYVPARSATLTPRDRIMSRLGANDNILAAQSTFFVELSETHKILRDATPRSLVILDELGRGTSSVDGLAVAAAVLHHLASAVGCLGFFATHYHALAQEFQDHPQVAAQRMAIAVDDAAKRVTFLYRLESGVAEGSFGMHCASMCGISSDVVTRAEEAADRWEHSGRVRERVEQARGAGRVGLGWLSDVAACLRDGEGKDGESSAEEFDRINERALGCLREAVARM